MGLAPEARLMNIWEYAMHLVQLKHNMISIMYVSLTAHGTPIQKSLTLKELLVSQVNLFLIQHAAVDMQTIIQDNA